jgi:hypothetical protein
MCKINCSGGCPDCSPEDHPKPHKHAALIKAWADGAGIQYKSSVGTWETHPFPTWLDSIEYRIKPEPKPNKLFKYRVIAIRDGICFEDGHGLDNVQFTFDGETGILKKVELI